MTTRTPLLTDLPLFAGLTARRLGIDSGQQGIAYLHRSSPVCVEQGVGALDRVEVDCAGRHLVCTVHLVADGQLEPREVGLSECAWQALGIEAARAVRVRHAAAAASFGAVRAKIHGQSFTPHDTNAMVRDIASGRYSDIELAAVVAACTGDRLHLQEIVSLTSAMVDAGQRLHWNASMVVDKHCVGGLPGNRTTPLIVAIVAANGLLIPKTSSRAITSPAGTADMMETLAPVELDIARIRRVVEQEGGCVVWGGTAGLSPADDVLIRVERPLDLDSDGLMIASVLSKKIAAGANAVVIDIPVGPSAKLRSPEAASRIARRLVAVGAALELSVQTWLSDGSQPVGRGIGPALEAMDVLAVLQGQDAAPADLRERALVLAGHVLEMGGKAMHGEGYALATATLRSGAAWAKFQAICEAQGGMRQPPRAAYTADLPAPRDGRVKAIDNRVLARVAKLAGAPVTSCAGLVFHAPIGTLIHADQPLLTIHANSGGELAAALAFARAHAALVELE